MLTPQPEKRSSTTFAVIALIVFALTQVSRDFVFSIEAYAAFVRGLPEACRWLEDPIRSLVLCMLGVYVAHRTVPWRAFAEFGLNKSARNGLLVGLIVTLPMSAPCLIYGKLAAEFSPVDLLFYAGVWPMAEEIVFRGYTFRQLHRRADWNLWLAAVTTGAVFGLLHLGNASVKGMPLSDQLGVLAVTGLGGILFAWIFARWNDNLWVPFAIHGFMNLWWNVFDIADNPLGGQGANIMRAGTVVLVIGLTLKRPRWLDSHPCETALGSGADR